jgi:hypothetical protein
MQIRHTLVAFLFVVSSFAVHAQDAEDAAKEKHARRAELIEQIISEAPNLLLAENRAIVSAKAGNLLWKSDPERARGLFLTAASELLEAQAQAEVIQKRTSVQSDVLGTGSTRSQILNMLANHDAELALEILTKTRTPLVTRALAAPKGGAKIDLFGNLSYLLQHENDLEQRLMLRAADQNPARMEKLLKEALARNFSHQTLGLIKKLHEKEPHSAGPIAAQLVDKLIAADLSQNDPATNQVLQNAINFLIDFIQPRGQADKSFRFDELQMRALSDKLISYYLGSNNRGYFNPSIVTIAEKLAPAKVERLKAAAQARNSRNDFGHHNPELQKLLGSGNSDELLAASRKFPVELRPQIYQHAVNRLIQQGEMDRALAVIKENYSPDAIDDAMRNLKTQYAHRLINQGRFAEAELIIDEQPENIRSQALINLANAIYQKDRVENKAYAIAVMGKVLAMLPERPENNADMTKFMQVIQAYANIDSSEAVRIYEQLIPKVNELTEAAVVLNPFQGNTNIQNGEILVTHGGAFGNLGFDYSILNKLARNDLEQTLRLVNTFSRREMRLILKMQLAETIQ